MLKVIVDFNRKKDKNRSVMNFYSDRESDPRGQASSGGITDLSNSLSQLSDNASVKFENSSRLSISPEADAGCGMRNAECGIRDSSGVS